MKSNLWECHTLTGGRHYLLSLLCYKNMRLSHNLEQQNTSLSLCRESKTRVGWTYSYLILWEKRIIWLFEVVVVVFCSIISVVWIEVMLSTNSIGVSTFTCISEIKASDTFDSHMRCCCKHFPFTLQIVMIEAYGWNALFAFHDIEDDGRATLPKEDQFTIEI